MGNNQSPEPLQIQPALLTIPQVCEYLNIARPTFYKLKESGAFGLLPIRLGTCRKVLYSRIELDAYVINKHRLKPITRVGIIRLFSEDQIEAIQQGLYLLRTGRYS